MGKVVYVERKTVLSNEGEIQQEEETKIVKMPKEPPYVKMYLQDLTSIYKLKRGVTDLLYELVKNINWEGCIALNSAIKRSIASRIGCTTQTIDNNIKKLVTEKIIIRKDRGLFEVNPHLFAKGEWQDIHKRRENSKFTLSIEYNGNVRSIRGRSQE